MLGQSLLANNRHGFVRREIVLVVFEHKQIKRRDQTIGGVSRGEVDLLVFQGARKQAEVHDARRSGKEQAVGCGQAFVAIWAFHELIPKTGPPLRRVGGGLRDGLQAEEAGIISTNFNTEGIVESEKVTHVEV